jgi:hypothetical protein
MSLQLTARAGKPRAAIAFWTARRPCFRCPIDGITGLAVRHSAHTRGVTVRSSSAAGFVAAAPPRPARTVTRAVVVVAGFCGFFAITRAVREHERVFVVTVPVQERVAACGSTPRREGGARSAIAVSVGVDVELRGETLQVLDGHLQVVTGIPFEHEVETLRVELVDLHPREVAGASGDRVLQAKRNRFTESIAKLEGIRLLFDDVRAGEIEIERVRARHVRLVRDDPVRRLRIA